MCRVSTGGTLALAVAWGILLAGIVSPLPASADSGSNCAKLRADIIDMDARSSTLPGYLDLRATLGGLYARLCDRPTGDAAAEFWYDLDGHKLGSATAGRPPGAVFTATEAVARACAGADNPSMCAMLRGSTGMCPDAPDPETRKACVSLLAYPTSIEAEGAPPLPPISVVLAGKPYQVAAECADTLANLATSTDIQGDSLRNRLRRELMLDQIRSSCPQFLAALEGRLGANAEFQPRCFLAGPEAARGSGLRAAWRGWRSACPDRVPRPRIPTHVHPGQGQPGRLRAAPAQHGPGWREQARPQRTGRRLRRLRCALRRGRQHVHPDRSARDRPTAGRSNRPRSLPCKRFRCSRRRRSPPTQPRHRGRRRRRARALPCRRNASSSSPTTSPPRGPMTGRRRSPATMR